MLALIVVLPLAIAALLALLLRTGKKIGYISLAASVLSLLLAVYFVMHNPGLQSFEWFGAYGLSFSIATVLLPLNALMLLLVAVVAPLIIAYSIGFMDVPSEQGRYYFGMCAFAASMMLFAMAAGFITVLIGWGLLGITSYILIGFWYWHEKVPGAARKAITIALIGDALMLASMAVIWNIYGTFSFAAIMQQPAGAGLVMAMTLLALAVFSKSAQFPFHEWLPDAMEGPTPVSAFLHSSTMVKAGVFLLAVLLPLFEKAGLQWLLISVGLVSAVLGASNAIAETHIKRVLAYSTIEDLGLMTVALGFGSLAAAMLLFVVQTFYKSLLFLCAGAIMRANDNEENIYMMRSYTANRPLFIAALVGAASLAGVFPLAGFFGKVAVESSALHNLIVYAVLVVVGFASSIYSFRWFLVPLRPGARSVLKGRYSSLPKAMLASVYILAALAVICAVAYVYLPGFLNSTGTAIGVSAIGTESAVMLAGIAIAYTLYYKSSSDVLTRHSRVHALLLNGMAVNSAYLAITGATSAVSRAVYAADSSAYSFVRRTASSVSEIGSEMRLMVSGRTDMYAAAFVIGVIAIAILFAVLI